jgi:VanZ family protein
MKIAKDKWKHFYVGIAMGAVLQAFFTFLLDAHFGWAIFLALVFSIAIGYGFELFSKFTGKGHYDVMDAVAAVVGAILGIGGVIFVHLV